MLLGRGCLSNLFIIRRFCSVPMLSQSNDEKIKGPGAFDDGPMRMKEVSRDPSKAAEVGPRRTDLYGFYPEIEFIGEIKVSYRMERMSVLLCLECCSR